MTPAPPPPPPRAADTYNPYLGSSEPCISCADATTVSLGYTSYAAAAQCDVDRVDLDCIGSECPLAAGSTPRSFLLSDGETAGCLGALGCPAQASGTAPNIS